MKNKGILKKKTRFYFVLCITCINFATQRRTRLIAINENHPSANRYQMVEAGREYC